MWSKAAGRLVCAQLILISWTVIVASSKLPEPGTCGADLANRIYGGSITHPRDYPWTALLVFRDGLLKDLYWCGGSLISNRYILTAAHCVDRLNENYALERIRLGEWDLESDQDCDDQHNCNDPVIDLEAEKIIVHERFTRGMLLNDIALIKLKESVTFTETVSPVCLPIAEDVKSLDTDGYNFTAIGWGNTEHQNQTLQYGSRYKLHVQLNGVNETYCETVYGHMNPSKLCAGAEVGKDTCQGDSGGSLVATIDGYSYQYGIVSYGKSCGLGGVPGVYTRVTRFLDWIDEHMD